jgi:hypothetical protein
MGVVELFSVCGALRAQISTSSIRPVRITESIGKQVRSFVLGLPSEMHSFARQIVPHPQLTEMARRMLSSVPGGTHVYGTFL